MSKPTSNEIVIEIDEERHNRTFQQNIPGPDGKRVIKQIDTVAGNDNQYFFPIERPVRSRWIPQRFGRKYTLDGPVQEVDCIPGERIHVDLENRIGRVTDALGDPENENLYQKMSVIAMELQLPVFLEKPSDDVVVHFRTDSEYWTWVFWMRRIVDEGCAESGPRRCRPVQNVHLLPTAEDCAKSRKVKLPIYDAGLRDMFERLRRQDNPEFDPRDTGMLTPDLVGNGYDH